MFELLGREKEERIMRVDISQTIDISKLSSQEFADYLVELSQTAQSVVMNFKEYTSLLTATFDKSVSEYKSSKPVSDRELLKTGLYCYIGPMKVFCNKKIADGIIKVYK